MKMKFEIWWKYLPILSISTIYTHVYVVLARVFRNLRQSTVDTKYFVFYVRIILQFFRIFAPCVLCLPFRVAYLQCGFVRGQQSPKYQTTLLTYRTFNNPSLLANGTQTTSNKFTDDSSRRSIGSAEISWNGRKWRSALFLSLRPIRPALKPHHRDYQRDSRFVLRHYRWIKVSV